MIDHEAMRVASVEMPGVDELNGRSLSVIMVEPFESCSTNCASQYTTCKHDNAASQMYIDELISLTKTCTYLNAACPGQVLQSFDVSNLTFEPACIILNCRGW